MKTLQLFACFIGLAVFITLGNSRAQAQAEIDPDHYETADTESLPQSKMVVPDQVGKMRCEGNFLLPSSVKCNGTSLPPGRYLISVNSEGRTVRITLNRPDAQGSTQEQNQNRKRNRAIPVAERKTP